MGKNIKIALLGKGKTGHHVLNLVPSCTVFDTQRSPSVTELKKMDVIISFLPGSAFKMNIPLLTQTHVPLVVGSTGFDWPLNFNELLIEKKLKWVYASNFALGINIVKKMIEILSKSSQLFEEGTFGIHEVHHSKKIDAPSGTALSFKEWVGKEAAITYERTGEVVGDHEIVFNSLDERILLKHTAKNRRIFAQGALWAAHLITKDKSIPCGLTHFNDMVYQYLNI